ncbi:hypothetical protein HYH39_06735 [Clostridium botulinum]|uniref:hypothetical protein n=1 Tax=Clostridium botulinum TaxID=1491 RepID=UPI0005087AAF|nr:hypothetical protein [Clostridium botulinum]KFX58341.1 hypothetical protein KU40_04595 [Clostridium botulinum]MBN1058574.1 hypothetical protein [Clostridium botulinum]MBY6778636.1 hypothetical protein [Clostridium botulinum]MBY6851815.1 hypothetical protein [Clostridium botulinum]
MNTREKVKRYLKITGAEQKWISDNVKVSKTCISRWLSDKDDYIPKQPIITQVEKLINRTLKKLNNELNNERID